MGTIQYLFVGGTGGGAGVRLSEHGRKQSKKLLSTLRLHLEASRDGPKASERIPVYREKPVWLSVEKEPFLTETQVSTASVIEALGGFALSIQFDRSGAEVLEEYSVENRGRKIAIFLLIRRKNTRLPLAGSSRDQPSHHRRRARLYSRYDARGGGRDRARTE